MLFASFIFGVRLLFLLRRKTEEFPFPLLPGGLPDIPGLEEAVSKKVEHTCLSLRKGTLAQRLLVQFLIQHTQAYHRWGY